jgi:hypothetical protein
MLRVSPLAGPHLRPPQALLPPPLLLLRAC